VPSLASGLKILTGLNDAVHRVIRVSKTGTLTAQSPVLVMLFFPLITQLQRSPRLFAGLVVFGVVFFKHSIYQHGYKQKLPTSKADRELE
jgi:hypothetical protein